MNRDSNKSWLQKLFESFGRPPASIPAAKRWCRMLMRTIALSPLMFMTIASAKLPPQNKAILHGNFAVEAVSVGWFKVLNWNINYGLQLEPISEAIRRENPDIVVLQEADVNARRTKQKNIAEELARRLSFNYAFGIEFEELSQGSKSNPAYHGQAILSRFPIQSSRVLRFTHQSTYWQPRPYLPRWSIFQPRLGGRMALVSTITVGNARFVFYDLHLESQGSDQLRLSQIDEVLSDMKQYPPDACVILAGDFNTDVRSSKVIQKVMEAGLRNVITEGSLSTKPGGAAKDGIFVRGPVQFDSGIAHQNISGSDHFPVSTYLAVRNCFEQKEKQK
jgi:endonuclease/exonuclease/phosphatase family metal-dependent hydrolase